MKGVVGAASSSCSACHRSVWVLGERALGYEWRRQKIFLVRSISALPADYIPRGSPARTTPRHQLSSHAASRTVRKTTQADASMPLLRKSGRKAKLVTQ